MTAAREIDETCLANLQEIGAKAWAGVDAQALRTGAGSTEAEAGHRLAQIVADIRVVLPILAMAAGRANRRSKAGKSIRFACDRLAAEVLA